MFNSHLLYANMKYILYFLWNFFIILPRKKVSLFNYLINFLYSNVFDYYCQYNFMYYFNSFSIGNLTQKIYRVTTLRFRIGYKSKPNYMQFTIIHLNIMGWNEIFINIFYKIVYNIVVWKNLLPNVFISDNHQIKIWKKNIF